MVEMSNRAFARRRELHKQRRLMGLHDPATTVNFAGASGWLMEALPEPLLVGDGEGNFIEANATAIKSLGYTRQQLRRMNVLDLVAATRTWTMAEFNRFRRDGTWHGELDLNRSDDSMLQAVAIANMLEVEGTKTFVAVIHELAPHAQAATFTPALEAASDTIDRAGTPIAGLTEVLAGQGSVSSDIDAEVEAAHLDQRLTELLVQSRLARGELIPKPARVDMGELLSMIIEQTRRAAPDVRFSLLAARGALVGHWDGALIGKVIESVILHALRRSLPGSRVRVVAASCGEEAVVTVTDEGPPEIVARPLVRRGLGSLPPRHPLDLAQRLVECHGGHLWLEDEAPNRGLTVSFSLPYALETVVTD
jgi:PAS domain S-box-containing protein